MSGERGVDALACVPQRTRLPRAVATMQSTREFRFVGGVRTRAATRAPVHPLTAYQIAFGRAADERVAKSLQRALRREQRRAERGIFDDEPGFIYCFHDLADDVRVLKIGRTHRAPEARLREWQQQLAPDSSEPAVVLLFAYRTNFNKLAERVVHEVLFCESMGKRLNIDGSKMEEFFALDNALAASIFVRQTLAFVEQRGADLLRRFRCASGAMPPPTAAAYSRKRKM